MEPSVEITKISLADTYDGTVEYTYKVDGTFGDKEYDVLIKVSVANGTKSAVVTHESVAVGSVSTNVNVKTLFGKAYPNVMLFAELKPGGGIQLWKDGPYWAKCNVGAESPEEFGYDFWWGDTVGYVRNAANDGWVSAKDGATIIAFSTSDAKTYGKNNATLLNEGWLDASGNLVAAHDAARAHLGTPWRMPTNDEIRELLQKCDFDGMTYKGVPGTVFRGRGDYASKGVFLPAAGNGSGSSFVDSGSCGYYWSSTPHSTSGSAMFTSLTSNGMGTSGNGRFHGRPVRPVR